MYCSHKKLQLNFLNYKPRWKNLLFLKFQLTNSPAKKNYKIKAEPKKSTTKKKKKNKQTHLKNKLIKHIKTHIRKLFFKKM